MTRKYLRIAALIPLLLGLTQCDRVQSLFKEAPPKPTPYDFTFTIEMTPEAAARLKATGDDLRVTAYFYGLATPQYRAQADNLNRLDLGFQADVYGGGARKIHIVSHALDPKNLPHTIGGKPYVFLTVTAMTAKGYEEKIPENMITCNGYAGPIDLLQTAPQVVSCEAWRP